MPWKEQKSLRPDGQGLWPVDQQCRCFALVPFPQTGIATRIHIR